LLGAYIVITPPYLPPVPAAGRPGLLQL